MRAQETPAVKAQISKYKKWSEKAELFPYTFRWNGSDYYYVFYKKWVGGSGLGYGSLVLRPDASVVPRTEAGYVAMQVAKYNTIVIEGTRKLSQHKDRPVWPIQNMLTSLERLEPVFFEMPEFQDLQENWRNLKQVLQNQLDGQNRLQEIYDGMKKVDDKVHEERDYTLLAEDIEEMSMLADEWRRIMYAEGSMQLQSIPDARKIMSFLKQQQDRVSSVVIDQVKGLNLHLSKYLDPNSLQTLRRSMSTFEKDEHGRQVSFASGERGLDQLSELNERIEKHQMQGFLAHLRNEF